MSKEEDELREFKRLLGELAQQAKSKDDLGLKLIEDLSARFDDYVAREKLAEEPDRERGVLAALPAPWKWLVSQFRSLTYGPPSLDPLTRRFVDELERSGVISRAQHRLVNVYRMIRLDPDKAGVIVRPAPNDYRLAEFLLAVFAFATFLASVAVWEVAADMAGGYPMAYSLGALLGYLLRGAFDVAWGRERLARYIRSRMPWLTFVSSQSSSCV